MKIGIISDVHCNIGGLDLALEQMGQLDEVICAGDAIFQFRFSNEVIQRLRERGVRMIKGNHEATFLGPGGVRAREAPWIQQDLLEWTDQQPQTLTTLANGKSIYVVHGSPWAPYEEYMYPHTSSISKFKDFEHDIVIMGHTHFKMCERVGKTLLINPGSAGDARDPRNNRQLSFAVLDTETEEVSFVDFPDPQRAALVQ